MLRSVACLELLEYGFCARQLFRDIDTLRALGNAIAAAHAALGAVALGDIIVRPERLARVVETGVLIERVENPRYLDILRAA